jgi:hypothetical protein
LSWEHSSVVVPGRVPASISCCFTQFRNVSRDPMPSFSVTAYKAAVSFGWPSRTSATMRTARRRSSKGYREGRAMTRSFHAIESPFEPGPFSCRTAVSGSGCTRSHVTGGRALADGRAGPSAQFVGLPAPVRQPQGPARPRGFADRRGPGRAARTARTGPARHTAAAGSWLGRAAVQPPSGRRAAVRRLTARPGVVACRSTRTRTMSACAMLIGLSGSPVWWPQPPSGSWLPARKAEARDATPAVVRRASPGGCGRWSLPRRSVGAGHEDRKGHPRV